MAWHDVECGGYAADLPLWRRLADAEDGPVLDLGAGTGRVALDLARRGHEVWALDVDDALLDALAHRAGGLPVTCVRADARDFALDRRFGLILAPMQTLQLLGGAEARLSCLRRVREHLSPGGLFAAAVAAMVEGFDGEVGGLPHPDVREIGGILLSSRPTAIRDRGDRFVLERVRERVEPDGKLHRTRDEIALDRATVADVEGEGRACGLRVEAPRAVPATDDHVGSEVVMLRA